MSSRPRLTFFGAAGEVTGSCTLVETARSRVLIDFGMIQGDPADEHRNRVLPPIDAEHLDAVLITHAHIDHCGRVPMLAPTGFSGGIYATQATVDLFPAVLHGSARLQVVRMYEHATARQGSSQRPGRGAGGGGGGGMRRRGPDEAFGSNLPDLSDDPTAPIRLYTTEDVDAVLALVRPCDYNEPVRITQDISARFLDAGHVIGSASIELTIKGDKGQTTTIVFSGDIGATGAPLLPPPGSPSHADVVVMESTYGGRKHADPAQALTGLASIIAKSARNRDKLIIPTFSLGRAQQLLHALGTLSRDGRLLGMGVYLDSKMAITASEVYARHPELLEPKAAHAFKTGASPLQFPELHYINDRLDSRRLNTLRNGGIIIAGAGFCHGGPIVHHLVHSLWREDARLLLIGHQPEGTPAYELAHGSRLVEIKGRQVEVNCEVHRIGGFSGHADHEGLMNWVGGIPKAPGVVLFNHGDDIARHKLAASVDEKLGAEIRIPEPMTPIEV